MAVVAFVLPSGVLLAMGVMIVMERMKVGWWCWGLWTRVLKLGFGSI